MANSKSLGELIKEARAAAGLTQEQLAAKVDGVTANDISKAERGQKVPTQNQLKQIAKATGVTQKSLLDAAKALSATTTSSGKTGTSGKTGSGKTSSSGKTGKTGSSKKTGSARTTSDLTATEKKLIELYRAANSDKKKAVMSLLKGETQTTSEMISSLLDGSKKPDEILTSLFSGAATSSNSDKTDDIVSSLLGAFMNKK